MNPQTIPLQLLASEWNTTVEALADQLGDKIIVDCLRIRHVRVQDARKLLEQRDTEPARHRATTEARNAEINAMI